MDPLGFLQSQAGINDARGTTTVNGQRSTYINVTLDGINIQDNFIRTNDMDFLPNLLLLDQVAEVTVSSSNADASASGGSSQVNFVTPSGTNQYHGSLYWSNRNSKLAANSFFNNASNTPIPHLNQNQIGGKVGGAIIKNKLFFYVNYEAYRQKQQTTQNHTVLTPNARNGIFTESNGTQVNLLTLMNVQQNPAMQGFLAKVPTTFNNFNAGDSSAALLRNTAGYQFNVRDNRTRDNLTGKFDYNLSTKNSLSLTMIYNRDILDRPDEDSTFDTVPNVTNDDVTRLLSFGWRYNPLPSLTNEARFGFNLAPALFVSQPEGPGFFVTGMSYSNPINTFLSQGRYTNTYNWSDKAAWIHGSHSVIRLYRAEGDHPGLQLRQHRSQLRARFWHREPGAGRLAVAGRQFQRCVLGQHAARIPGWLSEHRYPVIQRDLAHFGLREPGAQPPQLLLFELRFLCDR